MRFVNPVNDTLATNEIKTDIRYITVLQDIFGKKLICLDEIGIIDSAYELAQSRRSVKIEDEEFAD